MDTQPIIGVLEYVSISDKFTGIFSTLKKYKNKGRTIESEILDLKQEVEKLKGLNQPYPNLERDLNLFIGNNKRIESPKDITVSVREYSEKIFTIDKEVAVIYAFQNKLLQYPDRFGRKTLTDKIEMFLKNINDVSINQLDIINHNVIPQLKGDIKKMLDNFKYETSYIEKLKLEAEDLRIWINLHKNSQNRYNLLVICTNGIKIINKIVSSPNYSDLTSDKLILERLKSEIEKCENGFANEVKFYRDLKSKINTNNYLIWKDDYDSLIYKLDIAINDIYNFNYQIKQIESEYNEKIKNKEFEISSVRSLFAPKILSKFTYEFENIEQNLCNKVELENLKQNIEIYLKEEKKRLIFQYVKWGGIVVAFGGFLWVVISFWPISGIICAVLIIIFLIITFNN